jgi:hypothetical protein
MVKDASIGRVILCMVHARVAEVKPASSVLRQRLVLGAANRPASAQSSSWRQPPLAPLRKRSFVRGVGLKACS